MKMIDEECKTWESSSLSEFFTSRIWIMYSQYRDLVKDIRFMSYSYYRETRIFLRVDLDSSNKHSFKTKQLLAYNQNCRFNSHDVKCNSEWRNDQIEVCKFHYIQIEWRSILLKQSTFKTCYGTCFSWIIVLRLAVVCTKKILKKWWSQFFDAIKSRLSPPPFW